MDMNARKKILCYILDRIKESTMDAPFAEITQAAFECHPELATQGENAEPVTLANELDEWMRQRKICFCKLTLAFSILLLQNVDRMVLDALDDALNNSISDDSTIRTVEKKELRKHFHTDTIQ